MFTDRVQVADTCRDITIPGPPRVKKRPIVTRNGVYEPRENREHYQYVHDYLALVVRQPFTGPVALTVVCKIPTRRRADIDNFTKLILDAGNGVLYNDDVQVEELHVYLERGVGEKAAGTRVRVAELREVGALL